MPVHLTGDRSVASREVLLGELKLQTQRCFNVPRPPRSQGASRPIVRPDVDYRLTLTRQSQINELRMKQDDAVWFVRILHHRVHEVLQDACRSDVSLQMEQWFVATNAGQGAKTERAFIAQQTNEFRSAEGHDAVFRNVRHKETTQVRLPKVRAKAVTIAR